MSHVYIDNPFVGLVKTTQPGSVSWRLKFFGLLSFTVQFHTKAGGHLILSAAIWKLELGLLFIVWERA